MNKRDLAKIAEPASYLKHVAETKPKPRGRHRHGGMLETVRQSDYERRHIVITTSYMIEVDGKPVTGHMGVGNDGRVHYHPVPNLSFASAVDLVKRVIDVFPEEFPPAADAPGHHHGGAGRDHGMGHGGMG
jgi:hypothetical protein